MIDVLTKELYYKGKDLLGKMDFEEAEKLFLQSIKEGDDKSYGYLLYIYLLKSDYKSISNILSRLSPVNGFSLYTQYWFKLMTGELDELNDILNKMIQENNYFLRVFAIKELNNKIGLKNIQEIIQQNIKFFGLSYDLHLEEQRASIFLDFLYERYHLAILQSKALLKEYPEVNDVFLDFIEIIFKTGNISTIKEILSNETIIKKSNIDYRIMYLFSKKLYYLNELDKAKEYLIKLSNYFKNNPIFHFNLGNIYFAKNNFIKAIDEYEEAISLAPLLERAYYNVGILYFKLRDINKAIKNFQHAIEITKKPDAIYNLSVCLIEKKELQDAYYYLNKIPLGYSTKCSPTLIKEQIKELIVLT